ncbi:hypothetical protein GCM10010232_50410 [Streptomyces amakusaensis]
MRPCAPNDRQAIAVLRNGLPDTIGIEGGVSPEHRLYDHFLTREKSAAAPPGTAEDLALE